MESYTSVLKDWYSVLSGRYSAHLKNPSIPLQKMAVMLQHTTAPNDFPFPLESLYFTLKFLTLQWREVASFNLTSSFTRKLPPPVTNLAAM